VSDRNTPSFDQTLAAARLGEPWALGTLYRTFQPGLLRLLQVIAPHQAEDIASDVWLDVAGALPRFDGDARAFRGWLATIARRRVIDAHRRAGRRRTTPTAGEDLGERPGPDRTDESAVAYLSAQSAIARVAAVLSAEQADVVLMRVVGGLDVAEVARALGKQPGAVRALQHRALRRLARQLGPEVLSA
jgi:RNA polymerase sigma-70 factor (ECF subfamily)